MRGADTFNESLFTQRHVEYFIPVDHPLRSIRLMVNEALVKIAPLFARMQAADFKGGRPSIAPRGAAARLAVASLLQRAFLGRRFSDRFERDHKKLDTVQRAAFSDCVRDLLADPIPAARRLHLLNPKRAGIYSVDLFTNTTTHKVTLTITDGVATFRRVDTHKAIDRNP